MFEDSTFESSGRIRTRSRGWMFAALAFNGSILLALILIPLIYPEALPRMGITFLMEVPPPPAPQPRPVVHVEHVSQVPTQIPNGQIFAPTKFPPHPYIPETPEITTNINVANMDFRPGNSGTNIFNNSHGQQNSVVRQPPTGPVRVSGKIVEGLLVDKRIPDYPAIARTSRTEGTVVLQATISRGGTIENLRVVSGHVMLQQAALNAVQAWRYRPYLLNGEPVEVETTVNVIFKLN